MTPEQARASLDYLEAQVGHQLAGMPVAIRDQWVTFMRDSLNQLSVDLDDPKQANAAFAGAYYMFSRIMPVSVVPVMHAQMAVAILRHLSNKSAEQPPAGGVPDPWTSWPW